MGIPSFNSAYAKVILLLCLVFVCIFLIVGEVEDNLKRIAGRLNIAISLKTALVLEPDRKVQLCSEGVLSGHLGDYTRWARDSNDTYLAMKLPNERYCRLVHYTTERFVKCIGSLSQIHARNLLRQSNNSRTSSGELHLAFVGDSRVRQHFYSVLKMLPDYDQNIVPKRIAMFILHEDVTITSSILNVRISFFWRPRINDAVLEMMRKWNEADAPFLLLIGMQLHHMLQLYNEDRELYRKYVAQLGPILNQLGSSSRVIWLNQYPTLEMFGTNKAHNTDIHSEKIYNYNMDVRRTLKDCRNIHIWDSITPVAEEFIRRCAIWATNDFTISQGQPAYANSNCRDYVHIGFVSLSRATQLLLNSLCNSQSSSVDQ